MERNDMFVDMNTQCNKDLNSLQLDIWAYH